MSKYDIIIFPDSLVLVGIQAYMIVVVLCQTCNEIIKNRNLSPRLSFKRKLKLKSEFPKFFSLGRIPKFES